MQQPPPPPIPICQPPGRRVAEADPLRPPLPPPHTAAAQIGFAALTTSLVMLWLRTSPWFIPFDASNIPAFAWWLFTRNYEATCFFILISMQVHALVPPPGGGGGGVCGGLDAPWPRGAPAGYQYPLGEGDNQHNPRAPTTGPR